MSGAINVELAGDKVCIAGGRARYMLPSIAVADLPSPLDAEPAGDSLNLDRSRVSEKRSRQRNSQSRASKRAFICAACIFTAAATIRWLSSQPTGVAWRASPWLRTAARSPS